MEANRRKTLHPAYRVTDLDMSLGFYTALGYQLLGRVNLGDDATLTVLKFPDEPVGTLELVHRRPMVPFSSVPASATSRSRSTIWPMPAKP